MPRRSIAEVKVLDVQKRRIPNKHYVSGAAQLGSGRSAPPRPALGKQRPGAAGPRAAPLPHGWPGGGRGAPGREGREGQRCRICRFHPRRLPVGITRFSPAGGGRRCLFLPKPLVPGGTGRESAGGDPVRDPPGVAAGGFLLEGLREQLREEEAPPGSAFAFVREQRLAEGL